MRRRFRLPSRDAALIALACAFGGWLLGFALPYSQMWLRLTEYRVFDLYSIKTAPEQDQPITIVGIDDATSSQLQLRWPFPWSVHAQLVDKLVEAGAAVIVFDVQFSEPSSPEDVASFAQSIANAGNVVLGANNDYYETAVTRTWQRMDPVIELTQAGAGTGWTGMHLAGDLTPRLMALESDAMWREAIRMLIKVAPDAGIVEPEVPAGSMIRYYLPHPPDGEPEGTDPATRDPRMTFLYLSYHEVINGIPDLADLVGNTIVLIGRAGGASADINAAQTDSFPTPFTLVSDKLTPGVIIHATQIVNAIQADMLEPAPRRYNLLLLSAAIALILPWLLFWRPLWSSIGSLAVAAATIYASFRVFETQHLWLITAAPVAGLVLAFVANGTARFLLERRRANRIRSTFSLYVSSEVVEQLIANPELARLGGERFEISVLFSDLAGFTSLSEKLAPDVVGQVVNTYLNEMTHVIHGNGGTVDKFIGDAVMAFWGAPLADAEHASHAVQTAQRMQQAMDALQPKFAEFGVDELKLRIGVNSGTAIVGNMGSDQRLSYTAIGDSVNLASRLEGANKAYGTPILVAEDTVRRVAQAHSMRQVDRVRVKGKAQPVDVFTPCEDTSLIAITERVWIAYLARDWHNARLRIAMLREISPHDRLATMLEERVSECEANPPPEEWDGSVALDKL